jgi:two-component system cell cycle response regulator
MEICTRDHCCPILLIEDNPEAVMLFKAELATYAMGEFALTVCGTLAKALAALSRQKFDLVVADLTLPDSPPTNTLTCMLKAVQDSPLVIMTSVNDRQMGSFAMQQGAQEYLIKDEAHGFILIRLLKNAIDRNRYRMKLRAEHQALRRECEILRAELGTQPIGSMARALESVERIADISRAA